MELSEPSGSCSYDQIEGIEARRLSATPTSGGSSGNGGRSSGNTSSRRRRRMSDLPSGTRLMAQFNAAADGWASGSRSFVGLEQVLDEWRRRHIHVPSFPEAPPTPQPPMLQPLRLARLLFLGPLMRPPASDDNVLIMDGVLMDNSGSRIDTNIRRSASFSGPLGGSLGSSGGSSGGSNGQVTGPSSFGGGSGCGSNTGLPFGLLGSGGGNRFGSNGQFSPGSKEPPRCRMQPMRPRISDVPLQSTGTPNAQWSPIFTYLFPPSLQGPAFPAAAPRAVSSYTDAAFSFRPPASYFTPPRVTISAPRPSPWILQQPETEPVQPPAAAVMPFAWPPTAEQDASFAQLLYGSTTGARRRLPVFEAICPEEDEE